METITILEFSNKINYYLEQLVQQDQNLIVTKDGKPYFKIQPLTNNELKDSIEYEGDIISSVNEKWESF
jgi:hypothetical protein